MEQFIKRYRQTQKQTPYSHTLKWVWLGPRKHFYEKVPDNSGSSDFNKYNSERLVYGNWRRYEGPQQCVFQKQPNIHRLSVVAESVEDAYVTGLLAVIASRQPFTKFTSSVSGSPKLNSSRIIFYFEYVHWSSVNVALFGRLKHAELRGLFLNSRNN